MTTTSTNLKPPDYVSMIKYLQEEEKRIEQLMNQCVDCYPKPHPPLLKKKSSKQIIEENTILSARSDASHFSDVSNIENEEEIGDFDVPIQYSKPSESLENCYNPFEYRKYKMQLEKIRTSKKRFTKAASKLNVPNTIIRNRRNQKILSIEEFDPNKYLERITSENVIDHFADFQKYREAQKSRWSNFVQEMDTKSKRKSALTQENSKENIPPQIIIQNHDSHSVKIPLLKLPETRNQEERPAKPNTKSKNSNFQYYSQFKEALQPHYTGLQPKNQEFISKHKKEAILRWTDVDEFLNKDDFSILKEKCELNLSQMKVPSPNNSSHLKVKQHFSEMKRNKSETAMLAPESQNLLPLLEAKLDVNKEIVNNRVVDQSNVNRHAVVTPPPHQLLKISKSTGSIPYRNFNKLL
ncbi:predicted protein [Naegleria gruberi]|uniref:Predicted protein n=1 Tax=Naegleria gruberi TaxID=5762 RepID=D2VU65_NAEGR|nr:uncharacterized protein NAEGRDRAFT_72552 [Naegleria gruberi]EFC39577.1 predicted protein [Naegleria gruberi]|eukprot:XP_002672321.1 predicted protein [Naegleria gruberi strain NEG-M]